MYRLLLPVAFLVVVVLSLLTYDKTEERADFVFVNRGDVFTLDPQRMSWLTDMQIAYCLYEGLVRWNTEDFSIELAAADRLDVSQEDRVYTFHIREDARWSNGAPVTAHDFRYSWMRLLTPDTASDYSNFFFSIKGAREYWDLRTRQLHDRVVLTTSQIIDAFNRTVGIRVLGKHTIQIELHQQVPYFLDQLALAVCSPVYRPSVEGWRVDDETRRKIVENGWHTVAPPPMSERRWLSVDDQSGRIKQQHLWARPNSLVSNGPFVLTRWRYKRDMRLSRNPHYHEPTLTSIDSIQAITIADANTAVLAFETGQVDWLSSVNVDYQSDMLAEKKETEQTSTPSQHLEPTFFHSIVGPCC